MKNFILSVLLVLPFLAFSQPANDNCSGALELSSSTSCLEGNVSGATHSTSPTNSCPGTNTYDVWYKFTATNTTASITVTSSTSFDAVIQVLSSCSGSSLACSDVSASGGTESVSLSSLSVGSTYYIRVYDYFSAEPATTTFTICGSFSGPLTNDYCSTAINITEGSCVDGTVLNATQSQSGCTGTADDDVWYSFTASSAEMEVKVTPASSFDPVVQVFSSCGGTSLTCTDAFASGGTETVTLTNLTAGASYYTRIYHWNSSKSLTPTFTICVNSLANPPANDDCADAAGISTGTAVSGTVSHATQSLAGCTGTADDDVWYSFAASSSTHYINILNHSFDAVIEVFDGCSGNSLHCTGQTGETLQAELTGLSVGSTYLLRVYSFSSLKPTNPDFDVLLSEEASISLASAPSSLCSGQETEISFSTTGTFYSGNQFNVYLSNNNYNYLIGSGVSSPISVTIPTEIEEAAEYKISVTSSVPYFVSDSSANISVSVPPIDISYNGSSIIIESSGLADPYQYKLNNNSWQTSSTFTSFLSNSINTAYLQDSAGCISSATFTVHDPGFCDIGYNKEGQAKYDFRKISLGSNSGNVSVIYDPKVYADKIDLTKNGVNLGSSAGETLKPGFFTFNQDASTGNNVLVKVQSSQDFSTADYLVGCPVTAAPLTMSSVTAYACSQTYISPGFGTGGYPNLQAITQTLYPETNESNILATIKSLQLAAGDTLAIYNGTTASGTPTALYTATTKISESVILATNSSGALTFRFTTNSADSLAGFKIELSCSLHGIELVANGYNTVCEGFFFSPDYPLHYPTGIYSVHTIAPATTGKFVRIDFKSFELDASDVLYIYNGTSTSAPLVGSYSGTDLPFSIIATNSSGALTFRLVSDYSTDYSKSGFYAELSCSDLPEIMAGGAIALCDRPYASPGFPSNYSSNTNVVETIYPETVNGKVRITFSSFATEEGYDKLYVYDGTNTLAPLAGTYSGSTLPETITATNSEGALTLKFTSDGIVHYPGFLANVSCVYATGTGKKAEKEISLYPIPANEYLNVVSPEKIYGYRIINILGEEVLKGTDISEQFDIEVSELPAGIYIINFSYPEGIYSRKFTVKR